MMRTAARVAALLVASIIGVGGALAQTPAERFVALEERLLAARTVDLSFHITSGGAFEADLRGSLHLAAGDSVELQASGHFGGEPVELRLRRQAADYTWGNAAGTTTAPAPEHLDEALLIGLTRMGLLHNLAMLTGDAPPDHADGGVREWVVVDGFRESPENDAAVTFNITVAGQPSGSATLEIDSEGAPVVRHQTVAFPEGEMRVIERYEAVSIQPLQEMTVSDSMKEFAERYTAAWNSGDPEQVASCYTPDGSLQVNQAEPAIGREAIAEVAKGFMTGFPDMELLFDGLERVGDRLHYRWTFLGTNTGQGGTGKRVCFSGYEAWIVGPDGLVADSLGHFDEAEYARQLADGVDDGEEQ